MKNLLVLVVFGAFLLQACDGNRSVSDQREVQLMDQAESAGLEEGDVQAMEEMDEKDIQRMEADEQAVEENIRRLDENSTRGRETYHDKPTEPVSQ